jgi:hypothetical protein
MKDAITVKTGENIIPMVNNDFPKCNHFQVNQADLISVLGKGFIYHTKHGGLIF